MLLILEDCKDADELFDIIYSIFVKMFDEKIAGNKEQYKTIAKEIWKACTEFTINDQN